MLISHTQLQQELQDRVDSYESGEYKDYVQSVIDNDYIPLPFPNDAVKERFYANL